MPIIPPKPLAEAGLGVRGPAEQDRALLVHGEDTGLDSGPQGLWPKPGAVLWMSHPQEGPWC